MKISGLTSFLIAMSLLGLYFYSYMEHNYTIGFDPDAKNEYSLDSLHFRTSHSQFYLFDGEFTDRIGNLNFWTSENVNRAIAKAKGVVGVGMFSYGSAGANVVFEVRDAQNNEINFEHFDHIAETDLGIESGKLIINPCISSEIILEKKLDPSNYRVRVYTSEIDMTADEFEAEEKYRIEIWPDEKKGTTVLKQYFYEM